MSHMVVDAAGMLLSRNLLHVTGTRPSRCAKAWVARVCTLRLLLLRKLVVTQTVCKSSCLVMVQLKSSAGTANGFT